MRVFRKTESVPLLKQIEELTENRQDMGIAPKPVHQNPIPEDERQSILGRVGGFLQHLLRRGEKTTIHRDPEEINVVPPATTEDNVIVSEKVAEAISGTDSAHQKTAEELEFTPSAETVAAPIDGLQLSIPAETATIPDTGIEIPSSKNNPDTEGDTEGDTTHSTDSSDTGESTPTDESESITNIKYMVKLIDGVNICFCTETVFVGWQLKTFNWKINITRETETTSSSSEEADVRAGQEDVRAGQEDVRAGQEDVRAGQEDVRAGQEEVRAGQEEVRAGQEEVRAGQEEVRAGQEEVRAGQEEVRAGQEEVRAGEENEEKTEERKGEKEDTSSKEVRQIQSGVPAPLDIESFNYHKRIGIGSFGMVFLVSHPAVDQLLALKIARIPPSPCDTAHVERQAMEATGDSRFFPQLYATFHTEDYQGYVMEYLKGISLNAFITTTCLDCDTIRFIAAELLCAIHFLHARGITHGDLHKENIFIDSTGHVKIIDFGMAKITSTEPGIETPTTFSEDYFSVRSAIIQMRKKCVGDLTPIQDFTDVMKKVPDDSTLAFIAFQQHPFFKGINWDEMEAGKISPPFVMEKIPEITRSSELDVKTINDYFDEFFKGEQQPGSLENLQGFDFVSDRWGEMQQNHH